MGVVQSSIWPNAKPFIKWAGGKQGLLAQYRPFFPKDITGYIEPFLGGGAVFFFLQGQRLLEQASRIVLADFNLDLITCWQVVRDNPGDLIGELWTHKQKHSKVYFYQIRDHFYSTDHVKVAARLIYLNKTCFNGLFRVNRQGRFNVPIGNGNQTIYDPESILAVSKVLGGVEIKLGHFDQILAIPSIGLPKGATDFVYLDPPYDGGYVDYTAEGFSDSDQILLADFYDWLDSIGYKLMLSNSDTPLIRRLYQGYEIDTVKARRSINSNPDGRGEVVELVIRNYI